jgi:hypothetical protein
MTTRATNLSDAPFVGIEEICAPPPAVTIQAGKPAPAALDYRVGDRVAHTHFGQGVVVAVDSVRNGKGSDWHLTVRFSQGKLVKLLAGVAPLERLA